MPPKPDENPISSKFEFWTELPVEMQLECIKRMDFKTRMQFRATSKQDKLLVESTKKYQFNYVGVKLDNSKLIVVCKKAGRFEVKMAQKSGRNANTETIMKTYHLSLQILKFSNTNTFDFSLRINGNDVFSKFLIDISNLAPFHFKSIILDWEKFAVIDFFLKNCNSLESIKFEMYENDFETDKMIIELVNLPSVINAKTVQMMNLKAAEIPYQLITKWFEKENVELGKTLQIEVEVDSLIKFLAEKFENRVVSETSETLRLRMHNPAENHIFIRKAHNKDYFYTAVVIPSDKNESEIESDDQWLIDIAEEAKRNFLLLLKKRNDQNFDFADFAAHLGENE